MECLSKFQNDQKMFIWGLSIAEGDVHESEYTQHNARVEWRQWHIQEKKIGGSEQLRTKLQSSPIYMWQKKKICGGFGGVLFF